MDIGAKPGRLSDGGETRCPHPPEGVAVDVNLGEDRLPPVKERRHVMRQPLPLAEGGLLTFERRELHAHMAILRGLDRRVTGLGGVIPRGRSG